MCNVCQLRLSAGMNPKRDETRPDVTSEQATEWSGGIKKKEGGGRVGVPLRSTAGRMKRRGENRAG